MKDLKKQLIRLGYAQPELREHLTPVLNTLQNRTASLIPGIDNSRIMAGFDKELQSLNNEFEKIVVSNPLLGIDRALPVTRKRAEDLDNKLQELHDKAKKKGNQALVESEMRKVKEIYETTEILLARQLHTQYVDTLKKKFEFRASKIKDMMKTLEEQLKNSEEVVDQSK